MGREIAHQRFTAAEFATFRRRLAQETALLTEQLAAGAFSERGLTAGVELEAWLVDADGRPAAQNAALLAALGDPMVVPELAAFNIELNTAPYPLAGDALTALGEELTARWHTVTRKAADRGIAPLAIGILPSVREADLDLAHMSAMTRYRALNEQVMRRRHGRPLRLDIRGRDHLLTEHGDLMLEAAATSLQLHLQVPASEAARWFNAALVAAAPVLAPAVNAPFLFGRALWAETRIPLFEQAVAVGPRSHRRVTLGSGYCRAGVDELFAENLRHYPVLLPECIDEPPERFAHLRLHNGTIWRWVRPLVGFDPDGRPHLRIEFRVLPAGPTITDCIANAAFAWGLWAALARGEPPPERMLSFVRARANLRAVAREGLDAHVRWSDGRDWAVAALLSQRLLPAAADALAELGVADAERWLGIVAMRAAGGQTGCQWQRRWAAQHGDRAEGLVRAYRRQAASGRPVHEWEAP